MYNIIYSDRVKFKDAPRLSSPIRIIIKSAIDEKLLLDYPADGSNLHLQVEKL